MPTRAADDFGEIGRRMRELRGEPPVTQQGTPPEGCLCGWIGTEHTVISLNCPVHASHTTARAIG